MTPHVSTCSVLTCFFYRWSYVDRVNSELYAAARLPGPPAGAMMSGASTQQYLSYNGAAYGSPAQGNHHDGRAIANRLDDAIAQLRNLKQNGESATNISLRLCVIYNIMVVTISFPLFTFCTRQTDSHILLLYSSSANNCLFLC